jgi:bacterioferritin-associated ferredoxin
LINQSRIDNHSHNQGEDFLPMYLCICNAITDHQARSRATASCSVAAFYRALGVKPKCGKCVPLVRELLDAEANSVESRQDACGAEG